MGLLSLLQHPLTKGMDLDDPETTNLRKKIIQEKPLLKKIYEEWYRAVCDHIPAIAGSVLELGSGAGFLKEYIPDLITSDLMPISGIDIVCDAHNLPFKNDDLKAVVLINVLHHIRNPQLFFAEAERCVKEGGVVIMVEPWVSAWSRIIYGKMHHEPFVPESPSWNLPQSGPLSGGNDALPWIIFQRDQKKFDLETNWRIKLIEETMPLRYLLSGGVSMRNLLPAWMISPFTFLEKSLPSKIMKKTAMFAIVVIEQKRSSN